MRSAGSGSEGLESGLSAANTLRGARRELDDQRRARLGRDVDAALDAGDAVDSALRAVSGIRRELQLRDAATAMALEGLALELCSALVRGRRPAAGRRSRWLRRATELLHDRFRDPDLRFRGLAEEVGVHPVSFTRAFRAAHGSSPGEYLRRLRVEWAEERIRTGDAPLAEIAADAGFADQSHLTRVFRAELGITPGAWRRRHR